MDKLFCGLIVLVTVAACATFGDGIDRSADEIARNVDRYCLETSEGFRDRLRATVNTKTRHTIEITCVD